MDDFALMASGATVETGFFGTMVDAINGGPQKRRRTREAQAEAARLSEEAAALEAAAAAERNKVAAFKAPLTMTAPAAAPSLIDRLRAPSPVGLPWWAVGLVVAGGIAWAVRR